MTPAFLVILLAIGWGGITGNFSGLNLIFGAIIGGGAVLLLRDHVGSPSALRTVRHVLGLVLLFLYELVVSAVRVALIVIRPNIEKALSPAIVAVPVSLKTDAEITILANMITLTPGTLSIDVSADRQVIYVHTLALSSKEALVSEISDGFERKVREVFE
ncbi:Na+/H+ antiporter subunit E [Devosia sp. PTR5]|uniref:Na+/H+ antiporter subunit E n=1 Tax=Devosia oryzisoli TaxID=2774138 RepID=A0A927FV09_9HYPH|nr:Na+/H+ antiporter subunit E [Devosia oryzisoli]MBD8065368.1 Na+/H+ antiporter subunit E [Devosia oryzisoli]